MSEPARARAGMPTRVRVSVTEGPKVGIRCLPHFTQGYPCALSCIPRAAVRRRAPRSSSADVQLLGERIADGITQPFLH